MVFPKGLALKPYELLTQELQMGIEMCKKRGRALSKKNYGAILGTYLVKNNVSILLTSLDKRSQPNRFGRASVRSPALSVR